MKMFRVPVFLIRVGGFGCWLVVGREEGGGRREKGEGRRIGRRNGREKKRKKQIRNTQKHPKTPTPNPQNHGTSPPKNPLRQKFKTCQKIHKPQTPYPHIPAKSNRTEATPFPALIPPIPQAVELERTSEWDS